MPDGCTAWLLSGWLNGLIGACCDAHDLALDHSTDLATFVRGNIAFFECVRIDHPVLAFAALVFVAGPVGVWLYLFGRKRKA